MSNQASSYRALLWLFVLAALVCLYGAYLGMRGQVDRSVGLMCGIASVVCLFTGAWFGWKGAQIRIEERNKKADAIALITLAAFLKDKSEAELEAAVAKGGPAGEAARLVLERKRTGLTRPSGAIPKQPEVN